MHFSQAGASAATLCRACLEGNGTVSVFECADGVQLAAKLMKCAAVRVAPGDGLPAAVCAICAAALNAAYEFSSRAEAADRALRAATPLKLEPKQEPEPHSPGSETTHYDDENRLDLLQDAPHSPNCVIDFKMFKKKKCDEESYERLQPIKFKIKLKGEPIQCSVCDKTFRCNSALVNHERTHTKQRPYSCDICKKSYTSKHILKIHVMRHYGKTPVKKERSESDGRSKRIRSGPFQCSECGRVLASRAALDAHVRTHTGERPFACSECNARFRLRGTLVRHEAASHPALRPDSRYVCEHCGKTFRTRTNIVTHLRVHSGERPYACAHCPARFSQRASHARHSRRHTGERPHACATCGRAFREACVLRRHLAVHSAERAHACAACGKAFKSRHALQAHVRVHEAARAWVCAACGLALASKAGLKAHTARAHSERAGLCSVCARPVPDVRAHMAMHAGARPHTCDLCARSYATRRSLAHHVSFKHRNADKLQCTINDCHRRFPTAPMLEYHVLKAHTGACPFECGGCSRAFRRRSDLTRHLRAHHHAGPRLAPDPPLPTSHHTPDPPLPGTQDATLPCL